MKCKKHVWEWLYFPTPNTDKIGWIVANLTPGGGLSPKDDCVCLNCGAIGWRRKSRYGNHSVYENQWRAFFRALELANHVKLAFPTFNTPEQ